MKSRHTILKGNSRGGCQRSPPAIDFYQTLKPDLCLSLDTIAILVAATGAQILYCSFHPHLSLHTTGAAAVSQCLNLCAADKVKVIHSNKFSVFQNCNPRSELEDFIHHVPLAPEAQVSAPETTDNGEPAIPFTQLPDPAVRLSDDQLERLADMVVERLKK